MNRRSPWLLVSALLLAALSGCHRPQLPTASNEPPIIPVSQPVQRQVTDYVDFTGQTDAIYSTEIRARVTGYLTKMPFQEGAEIRKDDLLFEIDPRPYQAQLDRAVADVNLQEAKLKLARADNARAKFIYKMNPGAISLQDLDKYQAAEEEAVAAVAASKAQAEVNRLNLSFCKVTSPIDGQISQYYFTLGNLVNQDQTKLTTVVSVDPIYAYFDMDERTLLRIKKAINEGRMKPVYIGAQAIGVPADGMLHTLAALGSASAGAGVGPWLPMLVELGVAYAGQDIPVMLGLQGEEGFPHRGSINFVNNKVDPLTGTIRVRGVFPNHRHANRARLMSPGMFVRIRLPLGNPHPALLAAERCIATDQGLKNVFVVDSENQVQYRRVTPGPLQPDGLRVIEEGLKPDDWVVISGLQMIRPRMTVVPDRVKMPVVQRPTSSASEAK